SQVWGSVRLVPLLRDEPIHDLRLDRRCYDAYTLVDLPDDTIYAAFVPHAFGASWSKDGEPLAALGTQATGRATGKRPNYGFPLRFRHRIAQRETQADP